MRIFSKTLVAIGAALLLLALPLTVSATMSGPYAALFDNSAGVLPKFVNPDSLEVYINGIGAGEDQRLLRELINICRDESIRIRIAAGEMVTTAETITGLIARPNTQIEAQVGATWVALAAGNPRRDNFVSFLKAINFIEQKASIIKPQPLQAANGSYENFSIPFIQKHAAVNDGDAIVVARQRFQMTGPFNNEPAPPMSQNLDRSANGAFQEFKAEISNLDASNVFENTESYVKEQAGTFLRQLNTIDTIQYISNTQYKVRTYVPLPPTPLAPVGAQRDGVANQYVQYALTWSDGKPSTRIVNHLVTPGGDAAPNPNTTAWIEIPYDRIKRMPKLHPRVFYSLMPLGMRNDL